MAATKKILTSLHGRRVGLSRDSKLVVNGRTCVSQDDAGSAVVVQGTPGTLDATGTLTAALLGTVIVTSSTASAVVATLDTGTAMDTALATTVGIGEGLEWSAIATGANTFTVTAATDHTVVGAGAVASGTSKTFRSVRTAVNTWVTYQIA